ncbi:two-component system response regulator CreB [Litoribrevibacter albus]|uniref:DNA-binding response regulator n=1 Tax=Litoribrevibacter albus TaxID=1473156 RepID=A0AA37W815_9GAMM|nr:two-component system response regulator CreB [Litoribrevibacter albus]GLQ33355.1 DNA-binding response regulator [Litoribrevibacter albus]
MHKVLLVEDEQGIADNVIYALTQEGLDVEWLSLGQPAIARCQQSQVDLVILDVGLPDVSGFEVCKSIRSVSNVPVIFLTARGDEIDRVVGLEIGGDDYVVKPFSPRELAARVKAILRRQSGLLNVSAASTASVESDDSQSSVLVRGRLRLDSQLKRVFYDDQMLDLTAYEYGILEVLMQQPERIYSRELLMEKVWRSPEESFDRAVDTHIKTLRAKLKQVDEQADVIKTHRGLGYSLKAEQ